MSFGRLVVLCQQHASVLIASECALPDWVSRMQDAQPSLDVPLGSPGIDLAMTAIAPDKRVRRSLPAEKGREN